MRRLLSASLVLMLVTAATTSAQEPSNADTTVYARDTVIVRGSRTYSAASDAEFRAADFALRPRNSAQDILRVVPGLVIAQHAGGGKAEQIFLRGFDCDHGTDINIRVDGAPVNMVSHGHGQGYADLHFIIPETIDRIEVVKGPYFARYGDFTTAGAVTFMTADTLRENLVKFEGGSFDTYRGVALLRASLPISGTSAYFGGEIFGSRGYFEMPQDYNRTNLFAKVYSRIGTNGSLSAAISGFGSAWNASGQIPERAVRRGEITRFGSIDSLEGGATARTTAIVHYNSGGSSPLNITGSFTDYRFRLYSNFTFFLEDTARGDMIEQTDHRSTVSLKAENDIYYDLFGVPMHSRIGADLRSDDIRAALYHDSARTRLTTRRDALIRQSQTGLYGEQEIILPFAQILLGMRFDYIGFDVESLAEEGAGGIQQQAIVSPKANISIPVTDEMTLFLNSGFGFHSNDARVAVAEASRSTLPRAFGVETGIRYDESGGLFSGSAAAWMLDLESEIVYVGDEGATEPSGRTRRQGIDLEAHVAPLPWLTVGADATLSRGRFIDAPTGADYIPLAPNLTLSANVMAHLGDFTAAARLRAVDDRPANEDNSVRALGYSIVDLSAAYRFGRTVEGFLNVENLLDAEWNEAQFDTESRLRNEREPTDELHFTPGAPRSIRVGAAVHF